MKTAEGHNILSDLLQQLGVKHTPGYCRERLDTMPFKSLFGLKKLLAEFGIDSQGLKLTDKTELTKLTTPFIAKMHDGLVIVTDNSVPDKISYLTQGAPETIASADFLKAWTGVVFLCFPKPDAEEPDYAAHRTLIIGNKAKRIVLYAGVLILFLWLGFTNRVFFHWSTCLLTLIDLAGLWLTWMLVQKSLKISNSAADNVCRVLQEGGCDDVLKTNAAKFFGLFGWSEVGFTYFLVSLLCMLMFPQWICYLAVCNLLCLPFTLWSIWYQKFRAKAWCTLCVCVQCSLWLLFFCYLGGGWFAGALPLRQQFFVLGLTYVTVLLALNRITPYFDRSTK